MMLIHKYNLDKSILLYNLKKFKKYGKKFVIILDFLPSIRYNQLRYIF